MPEQISIIFNAGKGECEVRSINLNKDRLPESLPKAKLADCDFIGWYTSEKGGVKIGVADIDLLNDGDILYARYQKSAQTKSRKTRSKSSLRKQRIAIIVLAATVVLLIAAFFIVSYIVSIYTFEDIDGTKYLIKKDANAVYGLYDEDGNLCAMNSDGYYITKADSQVEIAPDTGEASMYATVDTEDGEVVGSSSRIMLYKQLTYDSSSSMAIADCSRIIQTINVNNRYGNYAFNRYFEIADGSTSCSLIYRDSKYILSGEVYRHFASEDGVYNLSDGIKLTLDGSDGRKIYSAVLPDGTSVEFNTTYLNPTTNKSAAKPNAIVSCGGRIFYILPEYQDDSITGYYFRELTETDGKKTLPQVDYTAFTDGIATYEISGISVILDIKSGAYEIQSGDICFGALGLSATDADLYDSENRYRIVINGDSYSFERKQQIEADTDGGFTLSDGTKITLDAATGRYTAENGNVKIALNTEYKGSPLLNISIKHGSTVYYIVPTYVTGNGTTYALYDSNGNALSVAGASGTTVGYSLSGATLTLDATYGGYSFATDDGFTFGCSSAVGDFVITGSESTPYSLELFASLAVACGYTLSMDKLALDRNSIDYKEYGLVSETRTDEDGNEYQYSPASFTVTSISGDSYTLYIGDMIVSEAGYYVRSSVRDAVYILSSSGISETLVNSIEALVTPTIVTPMTLTTYFNVRDFKFIKDVDAEGLVSYLDETYGADTDFTDEMWDEALAKNSTLVANFTYIPLEDRQNTINSSYSYKVLNQYMKGYTANDTNIMSMLESLYGMTFVKTCKLNPSDDDFEAYGLTRPKYIISYFFPTTDSLGNETEIYNFVQISAQTENGTYYAYSDEYDMIVEIDRSKLAFLEWGDSDWYKPTIFDVNIAHVQELTVEVPEQNLTIDFTLDNSATPQSSYYAIKSSETSRTLDDGTVVTYTVLGQSGAYALESDNKLYPLTTLGKVKYIVAADEAAMTAYAAPSDTGVPNVILTETDEDETTGYTTYFYYYIEKSGSSYGFAVTVAVLDQSGNVINSYSSAATAAYSTEYFLSKSGDLYLIASDSNDAKQLNGVDGSWSVGSVYYTKDEAYYLVNTKTGACTKLKGLTQSLYFYDDPASVAGITGIDHTGTKYKTSDGALFLVDSATGDLGYMYLTDTKSSSLVVYANGRKLDYSIPTTSSTGRAEERTAVTNFRKFFTALLYATIEGEVSLTDEEAQRLKELDDSNCQLVLTLLAEDAAGNRQDLRYRFYRLPGGGSYLTIECLDSRDLTQSVGTNGNGKFYILSSFVDKLIADAQRVVNGELVTDTSKY